MQERIITLATPVFFALIALELAWGVLRGRNTYRIDDAINSIGLGVLSQVSGVFTRVLRIGLSAFVGWRAGQATLPQRQERHASPPAQLAAQHASCASATPQLATRATQAAAPGDRR